MLAASRGEPENALASVQVSYKHYIYKGYSWELADFLQFKDFAYSVTSSTSVSAAFLDLACSLLRLRHSSLYTITRSVRTPISKAQQ